jgi:alginate O-acetyltransferase complex protein AlgI
MLFIDPLFLIFWACITPINALLARLAVLQKAFLLAASILFFAASDPPALLLFVVVLLANYPLLSAIARAQDAAFARGMLIGCIFGNLAVLAWFKYMHFFFGHLLRLPAPDVVWAPLALSFYVFHIISYAVDIHKRRAAMAAFVDYALYLSFFPHLLAGPIVRARQLIPQITGELTGARFDWTGAAYFFSMGFLLKNSADRIADVIDKYWLPTAPELSLSGHWLVAILYSAQIFGDFAGYSFMAVGIAKSLGYELPENFNAPYIAGSFREFWHRWHITLSAFLRDYLYVDALGGNRRGRARNLANLGVTMLLGGLWHGAAWHFVVWGAVHGSALAVERAVGMGAAKPRPALVGLLWFVFVQLVVLVAWVMFRSPDISFAMRFLHGMVVPSNRTELPPELVGSLAFLMPVVLHHLGRALPSRVALAWRVSGVGAGAMLFGGLILWDLSHGFVYFNF